MAAALSINDLRTKLSGDPKITQSDDTVFQRITFEDDDEMILPEQPKIERPFTRQPPPRKRYQNPDYYIEKKKEPEDANEKLQEILNQEKALPPQEKLKRRQDRAKNFGQIWGQIITPESDLIQKYQSKTAEQKGSKPRSTALHIDGASDLSTEQVFEYFRNYPPESLEWIDDDSCNIVFEKEKDCSLCFLQFCTPTYPEIHRVPDKKSLAVSQDKEAESEEEGELDDEEVDEVLKIADDNIYISEPKQTSVQDAAGNITNVFRYGPVKVFDGKIKVFTCRYAVDSDRKQPNAMLKSKYYQEKGNPYFGNMTGIFTNSFKNRYLRGRRGRGGFDDLPDKRSGVFSRLGFSKTEVHSDLKDRREGMSDDEDIDDLLKTADQGMRSRSRSPVQGGSEDSGEDSFDDMLMSMRAGRRMKLYADDIEEKEKKKQVKLRERVKAKHQMVADRLRDQRVSPERARFVPPPGRLTIQMKNEYAEPPLLTRTVSNRKSAKNRAARKPAAGFVDTRLLYHDDLEEAEENAQKSISQDPDELERVSSPEPTESQIVPSPVNSPEAFPDDDQQLSQNPVVSSQEPPLISGVQSSEEIETLQPLEEPVLSETNRVQLQAAAEQPEATQETREVTRKRRSDGMSRSHDLGRRSSPEVQMRSVEPTRYRERDDRIRKDKLSRSSASTKSRSKKAYKVESYPRRHRRSAKKKDKVSSKPGRSKRSRRSPSSSSSSSSSSSESESSSDSSDSSSSDSSSSSSSSSSSDSE